MVQASPRSSDGGEEDRKYEKSERSEHSEPQQPEPEVEAVVAAVNEVEIEKEEKLASEHYHEIVRLQNGHIFKDTA